MRFVKQSKIEKKIAFGECEQIFDTPVFLIVCHVFVDGKL